MAWPKADKFPAPYENSYSTDERPTPASMGGGQADSDLSAALRLQRRPGNGFDERLSAGLRRRIEQSRDRLVPLRGTGTAVGGQPLVIGAGGPKQGYVWELKRFNVGPVDYSAGSFPTGVTVILVIAGQETGAVADSAGQVVSMTTSYPAEGTWSREEANLLAGEYLRCIITGLSTGVVVTIGGQAVENAATAPETYGF